jgi:predicted Zn-dependent protease
MSFRVLAVALVTVLAACATSPLGRNQLVIFSDAQMRELGAEAYADIKRSERLHQAPRTNRYVRCVADAVIAVLPENLRRQRWEVNVFEDRSANAFALPGGKIGVNTGMLEVATDQDQLAAVVAHEVSHVVAQHGAERMSQQFATQAGLDLARVLAGAPSPSKNLVLGVLGLGAQYGILMPYSRTQESEADLYGLDLMAKAGFDPAASARLWRNMARSGGGAPPEFLSTHPSHETRIRDLEARIPAATALYKQARAAGRTPQCRP